MILRYVLPFLFLAACAQVTVNPRSMLTRDIIDSFGIPLLLAEAPELDVAATLAIDGANANTVTWITGDQVGIVLKDGLLVATRGLGFDLHIADVSGTTAALREPKAPTTYVKQIRYLSGQNEIQTLEFACSMAPATKTSVVIFEVGYDVTQHDEICSLNGGIIYNVYWQHKDKGIIKSQQWVTAEVGYILFEVLNR